MFFEVVTYATTAASASASTTTSPATSPAGISTTTACTPTNALPPTGNSRCFLCGGLWLTSELDRDLTVENLLARELTDGLLSFVGG